MIRITVEWTKYGNRLEMQGHAGMMDPEKGYDKCCLCCSLLMNTWCGHLITEEAHGRVSFRSQQLEKGFGSVRATAADGEYLRLKAGFDTILDGIKLIKHKFPDAIELKYIENDKERTI